ncbi:MAG TPA: hypothetical protein VM581_02600 [Magnetospirillaceae bacterium]|nr:hypothetical protein [Magnetospirillaceae bacterium]
MPKATGLALVPYARKMDRFTLLGVRLSSLMESNRDRIVVDFPAVVERYATPQSGIKAVDAVVRTMKHDPTFVALAVTFNGAVVGVATLICRKLMGVGMYCDTAIADGPQVAYWFCAREVRPYTIPSPLLPHILPLLAQEVRDRQLPGTPWTLVRPANQHSVACLADANNGFGGFVPWHGVSDYTRAGDGVTELRTLYHARLSN